MDHNNDYHIPHKKDVWDRLNLGRLMTLTFDLETTGLGMQGKQYQTPHYATIVEYAAGVRDVLGRDHAQMLQFDVRLNDDKMIEPGAAVLLRKTPKELRSKDRIGHRQAMAMIAWHAERSLFAYEDIAKSYDEELSTAAITDFNKQFSDGQKDATETFYNIPLRDDNGDITHDVRYHPVRRKLALRISRDANDMAHWGGDNLYYKDERDGSLWRWQDMSLEYQTYNGANYDIPILMKNMEDAGFHPAHTVFMRSRAAVTDKQRKKNYHTDILTRATAVALYGPQDKNGLKLKNYIDDNGKPRLSRRLGDVFQENQRRADMHLFTKDGVTMIDGSYFDEQGAHSADYDVIATSQLSKACQKIAPDICRMDDLQSDRESLIDMLMAQSSDGEGLPLFVIENNKGGSLQAGAYWFLGTDDTVGKFNNLLFLNTEGSLHKGGYENLSAQQWVDVLSPNNRDKSPVRVMNFNKRKMVLPLDYALQHTSQGAGLAQRYQDIAQDVIFIQKHPEMLQNIMNALAEVYVDRRFNAYMPQVPMREDEFYQRLSPEVRYMDEQRAIAKKRANSKKGAQAVDDIILLNHSVMNNTYSFMRDVDMATLTLALKPHGIEFFDGRVGLDDPIHDDRDDEGQLTPLGRLAAETLENFASMCESAMDSYKRKNMQDYVAIVRSMKKADGTPYFDGNKLQVETVGQALLFQKDMRQLIAQHYDIALNSKNPVLKDYVSGIVDKRYCRQAEGSQKLLLVADADNGEKGCTPYIADENDREVTLAHLKKLQASHAQKLYKNLVDENTWTAKFYRLRSEPFLQSLATTMDVLGELDTLGPNSVFPDLAKHIKLRRLHADPNEEPLQARKPSIQSLRHDIKRLQMGATVQGQHLEMPAHPALSVSKDVIKNDESKKILTGCLQDLKSLERKYPASAHKDFMVHFDAETGIPNPYIDYEIVRDSSKKLTQDKNFVTVDVPLRHVFNPISHDSLDLPAKGLILRNVSKTKQNAIAKGAPVVIRCTETGQLFSAARASLHDLTSRVQDMHPDMMTKAFGDYAVSGQAIDQRKDKFHYLGVEDLYPVANTRPDVNHSAAGLILPHNQFYALTAPAFANMGRNPLTTVIVPVDYVSQDFKPGQQLNLYEGQGDLFQSFTGKTMPEAGNMYQTTLIDVIGADKAGRVDGISLKELNAGVKQGTIDPTIFEDAGYLGVDDFNVRALKWMANGRKANIQDQKVIVARFDAVNKDYRQGRSFNEDNNSWSAVFNGGKPRAAMLWDHKPLPLSAWMLDLDK